jgi:uncharacterized protein YukE
MISPNSTDVRVATQALRSEADLWDEQGHELEVLSMKVNDLALGRLEAGVFQLVVVSYNEVVHQVAERTRQGFQAMRQISTALRQVADTYEAEDDAGKHRLDGLH